MGKGNNRVHYNKCICLAPPSVGSTVPRDMTSWKERALSPLFRLQRCFAPVLAAYKDSNWLNWSR